MTYTKPDALSDREQLLDAILAALGPEEKAFLLRSLVYDALVQNARACTYPRPDDGAWSLFDDLAYAARAPRVQGNEVGDYRRPFGVVRALDATF